MNERDLFLSAIEIEDPRARKAHLQSACAGNSELLSRVESLLASHEGASQFLQTPVGEQLGEDPKKHSAATIVMGPGSTREEALDNDDSATSVVDLEKLQERIKMAGEVSLSFLAISTRPDSLGRLSHYEILEVIGHGAFGTVLRAFDEKLQRVVAIKVMAPELAATSPARKRFLREAQASAAIRHENVVSVYAVEEKPIPYLVMEFIPGVTLQKRLQEKGPLDIPTVLRLGIQIAEGLDAAHAKDLIHRDIKPGNIMLETGVKDRVKITDFGLARAADDASMTQSGTIAGTPMYMAPEQALGHKLDQRADLFSFGSVLYQMVSGRPPFRAPSTLAVLKRLTEDTPRPIKEIIPEAPTWLCDIIAKLHAKNPNQRYQTAREIADVLADCEAQLKSHSGLKNYALIPRAKAQPSGWWKWAAEAAVALPLLAIGLYAVTRPATSPKVTGNGTTKPATPDPIQPVAGPTPVSAGKQESPQLAIAPFDAVQAKSHQEAWAQHLDVPVEFTNSIGMKFRLIPPGEFTMGSTRAEMDKGLQDIGEDQQWRERIRSEAPEHKVLLSAPIYLGVHEVTQVDYERVMGKNPSHFAPLAAGKDAVAGIDTSKHPVEMVSWNDAAEFTSKLSLLEQLKPQYIRTEETITPQVGNGYRLPSEAEWEFSCRAGTTTRCWIGERDDDLARTGWFGDNSGGQTRQTGLLQANPFGLHDMHGNVWEWVQDGWESNSYGQLQDKLATDPHCSYSADSPHGLRGGNWSNASSYCRASIRYSSSPTHRDHTFGFRVALTLEGVKQAQKHPIPSTLSETIRATKGPSPIANEDASRIATLPAAEQVEEFRKEMKRRNPEFDGTLIPSNENDVVTGMEFFTNTVEDISPIRFFSHLTALNCRADGAVPGRVADLRPLKGMQLHRLTLSVNKMSDLTPLLGMPLTDLHVDNAPISDLSPLAGMQLKVLNCSYTQVSSLKPLQGMPLVILWCNNTDISDLSPVKGMSLEWISIQGTKVKDISPLKGMPLTQIYLDFDQQRDGEILRSLTTLQKINDKPADEFWKDTK